MATFNTNAFNSGGLQTNNPKGTFWRGADNNVWVTGDQGTNSAGAWDNNTAGYWSSLGYTQQNDPVQTLGASTTGGSWSGGGGAGGGSGADAFDPQKISAINNVYDQRTSRLKGLLGGLDPRRQSAIDSYMQGFNMNTGMLEDAKNRGMRNLDVSSQQNDQNKVKSFRDISTGIRSSIDAFRNQLGTMNASDSSAADIMAPFAFSKLQTQERGDVLDTYNQNATGINLARQDVEGDFRNQLNSLKFEKDNAIRGIADQYSQIRQSIMDEIATSDEARAFELANLGQQYTMKALQDVQSLDSRFQAQSNELVKRYTSMMPKVDQSIANPQVQQQTFSSYGRTYAPQVNAFSGQDEAIVAPARRRELF